MIAILILLTIGLPWLGGLAVWLTTNKRPRAQHALAVAFAVAAGLAALLMLPYASAIPAIVIPLGGVFGTLTFTPDGMGVFLAIIATVIGSLAVIGLALALQVKRRMGTLDVKELSTLKK